VSILQLKYPHPAYPDAVAGFERSPGMVILGPVDLIAVVKHSVDDDGHRGNWISRPRLTVSLCPNRGSLGFRTYSKLDLAPSSLTVAGFRNLTGLSTSPGN
jgi:hypothetical protein